MKSLTAEGGSAFWDALARLVAEHALVIDRPKGSPHPRYPAASYPLDYGYLSGTSSPDGGELDVWRGSLAEPTLDCLVLTVDLLKRDAEIKLLLGCTPQEQQMILEFLNHRQMRAILLPCPDAEAADG